MRLCSRVAAEDGGHLGAGRRGVRREQLAIAAEDELLRVGPLHLGLRPGRNVCRVTESGEVGARRHVPAGKGRIAAEHDRGLRA